MDRDDLNQRLSKISTVWTMLRQAHEGPSESAVAAQQLLLQRYSGAIYRYVLRAVGDHAAADDLTQEFGLCLVRGQFRQADPQRGRFRDYVKAVLFHLVSKYRKGQFKLPKPLPADSAALAGLAASPEEVSRDFDANWRDELLARTWQALARAHPHFHAVLRLTADNPKMKSAEKAQRLSAQLAKPCTAQGVRKSLSRARDAFADLLLEEVAQSLESPTLQRIEEELEELKLLEYCRPALKRHAR